MLGWITKSWIGVWFQKDFWVWVGFGIVKKVSGLVRVCKIINTYPSLNQVVIDDFIQKNPTSKIFEHKMCDIVVFPYFSRFYNHLIHQSILENFRT